MKENEQKFAYVLFSDLRRFPEDFIDTIRAWRLGALLVLIAKTIIRVLLLTLAMVFFIPGTILMVLGAAAWKRGKGD